MAAGITWLNHATLEQMEERLELATAAATAARKAARFCEDIVEVFAGELRDWRKHEVMKRDAHLFVKASAPPQAIGLAPLPVQPKVEIDGKPVDAKPVPCTPGGIASGSRGDASSGRRRPSRSRSRSRPPAENAEPHPLIRALLAELAHAPPDEGLWLTHLNTPSVDDFRKAGPGSCKRLRQAIEAIPGWNRWLVVDGEEIENTRVRITR